MLPWLLVIVAESILVLHGLAAMWTILVGYRDRRDWTYYATRAALYDPDDTVIRGNLADPRQWPLRIRGRVVDVDILITVYGEPVEVVRRTAEAAVAMAAGGSDALEWEGERSKDGASARDWLRTKANSIEGGTSEIQLNIIAKHLLQLPGA